MKAKRQPNGTYWGMLSATDAGMVHKVQGMLAGILLLERDTLTAELSHTTQLGLEAILQARGPAPAMQEEKTDVA